MLFQIGWIKASDQTVLSLHKKVITHNPRIKVTHDEHRSVHAIYINIYGQIRVMSIPSKMFTSAELGRCAS